MRKSIFRVADVDRINEYLSSCNECHELELTAKTYLIRDVCRHFKNERWQKSGIVQAVEDWMSHNTMDPAAMTEFTRGKLPHMGKVFTAEHREKLRVAALGVKASPETRKKLSEARKRYWARVRANPKPSNVDDLI